MLNNIDHDCSVVEEVEGIVLITAVGLILRLAYVSTFTSASRLMSDDKLTACRLPFIALAVGILSLGMN